MNKLFICAALLVGALCNANADSKVSVKNNTVKVVKGEATTFAVEINNGDEITALQTNFTAMPENLTINGAKAEKADSIKYSATSNLADKSPVVVLYNLNNPATEPSSSPLINGNVYNVEVKASESFTKGEMTLTTLASKTGGNAVTIAPITVAVKQNGDKNDDGKITTNDIILVQDDFINEAQYDYIADFNNDGNITTNDAILIQDLFLSSAAKKGSITLDEE